MTSSLKYFLFLGRLSLNSSSSNNLVRQLGAAISTDLFTLKEVKEDYELHFAILAELKNTDVDVPVFYMPRLLISSPLISKKLQSDPTENE